MPRKDIRKGCISLKQILIFLPSTVGSLESYAVLPGIRLCNGIGTGRNCTAAHALSFTVSRRSAAVSSSRDRCQTVCVTAAAGKTREQVTAKTVDLWLYLHVRYKLVRSLESGSDY